MVLTPAPSARAMIFVSTGDPSFNTTAPTGALAASGWQWIGAWGAYLGTPISPKWFLSVQHVGGSVGQALVLNGVSYTTVAYVDDPGSGLRLWEIAETFPSWAPLYRTGDETGKSLVVFGVGDGQGAPVTLDGALKGWLWGSGRGTLRWGTNSVVGVENGGPAEGALLYATFDQSVGGSEAALADGDSSGPVFINTGAGWSLAGVAEEVDGPFYTSVGGTAFNASLFDARGLYVDEDSEWELITSANPVPGGFYATQISSRAAWIDSITNPDAGAYDTPVLDDPLEFLLIFLIAGFGFAALSGKMRPGHR
jgi:hypothetical protein